MKKTFAFAVIGGSIGVGYALAKSGKSEPGGTEPETSTATLVGGFAAAGAVVGFILDRKSRKRHRKASTLEALKAGDLVLAARAARPLIESAVEAARPKVEHAIDVARPRIEQAAEVTWDAAKDAAQYARPRLEHAVDVARPRVEHALESALDAARPKVDDAMKTARKKAKSVEMNGHRPLARV